MCVLKSDQNGIEIISKIKIKDKQDELKSDQNGIEIDIAIFITPRWIRVKIRPKWD